MKIERKWREIPNPKDKEKDQTYFLWAIPKDKLDQIIFPLETAWIFLMIQSIKARVVCFGEIYTV
mgnify:CR=1 FL=1